MVMLILIAEHRDAAGTVSDAAVLLAKQPLHISIHDTGRFRTSVEPPLASLPSPELRIEITLLEAGISSTRNHTGAFNKALLLLQQTLASEYFHLF